MPHAAAHHKMIKARAELVLEHPFFAHLAMRLELREDPTCRTAWSDGRLLAYNPHYVDALPLAKVKGMQCHEVLHLACCHHTRRNGRDERLWNMACDYAINPILLDAGLELPSGYLDNPDHRGKTADAIYTILVRREEELKGGAMGGNEQETESQEGSEGADQQEEGAGAEQASQSEQNTQPEESEPHMENGTIGNDQNSPPDPGSDPDADPGPDPGMSGEVRDAPAAPGGASPDEQRQQEDDAWQDSMREALHKSQEFGQTPGGLERLLGVETHTPLDWRQALRRFLYESARNDFSWARPNRRYLHAGLYLPGLENEELAELAVAVDVSGSITQPELSAFTAELSAVLDEFNTTLIVFTCDAAVTREERLSRHDLPLDFRVSGGGGTDFRPPFLRLAEEGISPACLLYFTDMECASFPGEPEYPVLWITPNKAYTPPPFGDVILMDSPPEPAETPAGTDGTTGGTGQTAGKLGGAGGIEANRRIPASASGKPLTPLSTTGKRSYGDTHAY